MMYSGDFCEAIRELSGALVAVKQDMVAHASASCQDGGCHDVINRVPRVDFRVVGICLDQSMMIQRCDQHPSTASADGEHTSHSLFPFFDNNRYYGSSACGSSRVAACTMSCRTQHRIFVHYQPMRIPDEWNMEDTNDASSTTILTIILLFNLALSYQLRAMREAYEKELSICDSSLNISDPYSSVRNLLIRAERIYGLCLSLLKDQHHHSVGTPPLFSLAVANNRGVIFTQLNESKHVTMCFQRCMSILAVFVDRRNQDRVPGFHGYLNNAFHHSCSTTVIVAQAA